MRLYGIALCAAFELRVSKKRLLSAGKLDLKKALEVTQGMKAAQQTAKHMHVESPGVHSVEPYSKGNSPKPWVASTPCP